MALQEKSMPSARRTLLFVLSAAALTASQAVAQTSDHDWAKTYSIAGKPSLTVETSDSNLKIQSCGECKAINIKVHSTRNLSDYRLEESQSGDHVSFLFKEKPHIGVHVSWHNREETSVVVETPGTLDLDAKTSDGNLSASDLQGDLQLHTGDGNADLDNLRGTIRLKSGDGNLTLKNASGTLDAHSSDGHMKVDGNFSAVQLHSSDGGLDFALADGAKLTGVSRIESSDGTVTIRVPHDFAADLDISTSDGHIDCSLPLTMDHYDSREGSGHHMHGKVNAGGVPLSIHTSDGNVTISSL
jgi:Putative adhesin